MTAGTGDLVAMLLLPGPNAGYDPVLKFRKKLKKTKEDKKLVAPGNKLVNQKKILRCLPVFSNTR